MGDTIPPEVPSPRSTAAIDTSTKPARWCLVDLNQSTIQARSHRHRVKHLDERAPGWIAARDFERRLNRNGIKMSEANSVRTSNTTALSTIQYRGGARTILDGYARDSAPRSSENSPPPEAATMASFTNTKETEVDALEKQLRQVQTEAHIWKERSETQERDLRASYNETMEWRMKYEDLYSAVIRGCDQQSESSRAKRGGTKSLG